MYFQKLKKKLMGLSFKLRPYEEEVLKAFRKELSSKGNVLLSYQLRHLCSYQRQVQEKMLCFFPLEKAPYPGLSSEILFPCRLKSCVVARIYLEGDDKGGSRNEIRGEVVLHEGEIASIQFNQPPANKLVNNIKATKVEILRDPMIPASAETVSEEQRPDGVPQNIHSKLPEDYLQLIANSKGALLNEWKVFSVQDIRKIPQRDGNYFVLTMKEGIGFVGVKEDELSGQLYFVHYDSHVGEKITVGLRKFLEEFDGGKVINRL